MTVDPQSPEPPIPPIPGGRLGLWTNALFKDHGALRLLYPNRHRVAPGVWRSAQPSPGQLAWFAAQGGRSVINLRGRRRCGADALAREACDRLGLAMIDLPLESRGAPHRDRILRADRVLDEIAYPVLFHCKSGADRVGLMSGLYLLLKTDAPVAAAQAQLDLRYLHFRGGKTGILDAFFERYRDFQAERPIPFRDWVTDHYDEDALRREFRPRPLGSFLVDRVLRRE